MTYTEKGTFYLCTSVIMSVGKVFVTDLPMTINGIDYPPPIHLFIHATATKEDYLSHNDGNINWNKYRYFYEVSMD